MHCKPITTHFLVERFRKRQVQDCIFLGSLLKLPQGHWEDMIWQRLHTDWREFTLKLLGTELQMSDFSFDQQTLRLPTIRPGQSVQMKIFSRGMGVSVVLQLPCHFQNKHSQHLPNWWETSAVALGAPRERQVEAKSMSNMSWKTFYQFQANPCFFICLLKKKYPHSLVSGSWETNYKAGFQAVSKRASTRSS